MMLRLMASTCLVASLAAAGCASDTDDDFATLETPGADDGKADLGGTYTYYTVQPDLRRCASPMCGGYWVSRVNSSSTRCHDGSYKASCYVAVADWSRLGLDTAALERVTGAIHGKGLLVRATIGTKTLPAGRFGEVRATEAWLAQGPGPAVGPFAIVEETGVRCFTTPCNSFRERKLNGSATAALAELGWQDANIDDELVGRAIGELFAHDLIITGERYTVRGPGGSAKARTVTQLYFRARNQKSCYVGGCSGQVCSDRQGVITTCEWRPEYACYADAVCERQADGSCGFTPSEALQACLQQPPAS